MNYYKLVAYINILELKNLALAKMSALSESQNEIAAKYECFTVHLLRPTPNGHPIIVPTIKQNMNAAQNYHKYHNYSIMTNAIRLHLVLARLKDVCVRDVYCNLALFLLTKVTIPSVTIISIMEAAPNSNNERLPTLSTHNRHAVVART